jgi:hypothetical protein
MELINKSLNKNYITARLFLEDIEGIETVLNESAEKFEIKTEDYINQNI